MQLHSSCPVEVVDKTMHVISFRSVWAHMRFLGGLYLDIWRTRGTYWECVWHKLPELVLMITITYIFSPPAHRGCPHNGSRRFNAGETA